MAPPDPNRDGSQADQRRAVGSTGAAPDAGSQDPSQQGQPGSRSLEPGADDPHVAPESGEKSEVLPDEGGRTPGNSGS